MTSQSPTRLSTWRARSNLAGPGSRLECWFDSTRHCYTSLRAAPAQPTTSSERTPVRQPPWLNGRSPAMGAIGPKDHGSVECRHQLDQARSGDREAIASHLDLTSGSVTGMMITRLVDAGLATRTGTATIDALSTWRCDRKPCTDSQPSTAQRTNGLWSSRTTAQRHRQPTRCDPQERLNRQRPVQRATHNWRPMIRRNTGVCAATRPESSSKIATSI